MLRELHISSRSERSSNGFARSIIQFNLNPVAVEVLNSVLIAIDGLSSCLKIGGKLSITGNGNGMSNLEQITNISQIKSKSMDLLLSPLIVDYIIIIDCFIFVNNQSPESFQPVEI